MINITSNILEAFIQVQLIWSKIFQICKHINEDVYLKNFLFEFKFV